MELSYVRCIDLCNSIATFPHVVGAVTYAVRIYSFTCTSVSVLSSIVALRPPSYPQDLLRWLPVDKCTIYKVHVIYNKSESDDAHISFSLSVYVPKRQFTSPADQTTHVVHSLNRNSSGYRSLYYLDPDFMVHV